MTGSLLKQHITVFIEEEDAECSMKSNTVVVHFVAVSLAGKSNIFVVRINENAIFTIEKKLLLLVLNGLGKIMGENVAGLAELIGSGQYKSGEAINY